MMQADVDASRPVARLTYCTTAGEALNPDLFDFWKEHTGLTIYEGFGQTETPLTVANLTHAVPQARLHGHSLSPVYHHGGAARATAAAAMLARRARSASTCIDHASGRHHDGVLPQSREDRRGHARRLVPHRRHRLGATRTGTCWYVGRNDDVIKSSGLPHRPLRDRKRCCSSTRPCARCAVTGVPDSGARHGREGHRGARRRLRREATSSPRELQQVGEAASTAPYKYPAHRRVRRRAAQAPLTARSAARPSARPDESQEGTPKMKVPEGLG